MNNNALQQVYNRFFRYGNVAMRYIGFNVLIFALMGIIGMILSIGFNISLEDSFVRPYLALPGNISLLPYRFYTFITYPFLHQGILHILFNMLWLYWMGNLFLDFLKPRQFLTVYWGGAVSGAFIYILIGFFSDSLTHSSLIGASAAVMAVFAAVTTLVPNYSIRLIIFGEVKLKYLLLVYLILDLIGTAPGSANIGGSLSHLGGALFGFIFIILVQKGTDLSSFFQKKPKLKIVKKPYPKKPQSTKKNTSNQAEIDAVLDKISKTGYEQLSTYEKQILFNASNKK